MPFQIRNPHTTYKRQEFKKRKEEDSFMTHKSPSNSLGWSERAYLSTSLKGSLVVEAALAIPFFFFAVCSLCFLLEVISIQNHIEMASHYACKEMVQDQKGPWFVSKKKLEEDIIQAVGKERLDESMIENGSGGIDCSKTKVMAGTGIVKFHVSYRIKVPIFAFGKLALKCEEQWKVKKWTGYTKNGFDFPGEEIVYITETGMVYHKDPG